MVRVLSSASHTLPPFPLSNLNFGSGALFYSLSIARRQAALKASTGRPVNWLLNQVWPTVLLLGAASGAFFLYNRYYKA